RELLHLPNLDHLVVRSRAPFGPFERLFPRLHLNHPVPPNDLLRLGERPVGHLGLPSGERDPRAHRRWVQAIERQQHARLLQRFVVLHHRSYGLRVGHGPRLGLLISLRDHQHHESHGCVSFSFKPKNWVFRPSQPAKLASTYYVERPSMKSTAPVFFLKKIVKDSPVKAPHLPGSHTVLAAYDASSGQ